MSPDGSSGWFTTARPSVESGHGKQRIEGNLSRSDFEEEFALARAEKRAPKPISVRAIGVDP